MRWIRTLARTLSRSSTLDDLLRDAYRLHSEGRLGEARHAYAEILERDPRHADALFLLGEIANREGRRDEAIALIEKALGQKPDVPEFHAELGAALYAQQRFAAAARAYAEAARLAPDDVAARVNLGSALENSGALAQAESAWREALALDGGCAEAACNLASLLLRTGRADEAQALADLAVRTRPEWFEAHMRHGDVLLERKRPAQAAESYRAAARIAPHSARALVGLGYALEISGDVPAGLACYDAAIAREPDFVQAHVSRAGALLALERYAEGWEEYEWRLRAPENAPFHDRLPFPAWRGEPLDGATVVYYGEQGLGDQIMYASCLPQLLASARACHVECEPRLVALFRRSFPEARIHAASERWWDNLPKADFKIAAASAPRFLRRDRTDFPHHSGYLKADPQKVAAWQRRLRTVGTGPTIGLSWRGGVQATGRAWRSLEPEQLAPLLRGMQARFVNLQYGPCEADIRRLQDASGVRIHHWPEAIDDYDEAAALVSALDLTISVPTAIVHLAGALGRPVWILAPVRPESRYGLRGRSMPWYPSAVIYRQRIFGEWGEVMAEAAADLRRFGGLS